LKYLWARERIRLLDDYTDLAQNDAHVNEITALGLKYNLLTAYTSFIAIDSEIRNEGGEQTTIKQPLPLPQGVSDYAIGSPRYMGSIKKSGNGSGRQMSTQYNTAMAKESIEFDYDEKPEYQFMESSPEFKGGYDALLKFLEKNIEYPVDAKELGVEGTVYIEFLVHADGSISDVNVISGVNKSIDEEAIRVVRLTSGKWLPGKQSGICVKATMVVPIKFSFTD